MDSSRERTIRRTGVTARLANRTAPIKVRTRLIRRNFLDWLLMMRRPMNRTIVRMKVRTDGIQRAKRDDDPYDDRRGTQVSQRLLQLPNQLLSRTVSCLQLVLECQLVEHETWTQDRRERYEVCMRRHSHWPIEGNAVGRRLGRMSIG